MILNIDPGINRYYVQTLCMVFFPGAKFSTVEEVTPQTPVITVRSRSDDETVTASVTIAIGEISVTAEDTQSRSGQRAKIGPEKVAIGAAFLKAGEKFFGYKPAWGILTGVRPTKLARDLINRGVSTREIRDLLTGNYFLNPKKANLVLSVAGNEERIIKALEPDTCSLYISIPFCPSRCSYCSFVSYSTPRLLSLIPDYIDLLCRDINETFKLIKQAGKKVICVYVGGGTPSILTPAQINRVLKCVSRHVDPATLLEYSFEAGRPDTITEDKLRILKESGVTRISVNTQTINDLVLETIGRAHTSQDFFDAYDIARKVGIHCINTDLIAGLPGESFASFSRSVDAVMRLAPENVTFHTFAVKRSADVLRVGDKSSVYSRSGGTAGKSVDYAQMRARNAGYLPYYMYRQKNTVGNYENVGYAREGYEGLYNIFMMEEVHSVFAVGAGAVSKMVNSDCTRIKRVAAPKYPYEYLDPEIHERTMADIIQTAKKFFAEDDQ